MESKLYMQLILWRRGVPWDRENEVDCIIVKSSQLSQSTLWSTGYSAELFVQYIFGKRWQSQTHCIN